MEKKDKQERRRYTQEFKLEAIRLALSAKRRQVQCG
jgi:transposase-like protein